MITIDRATVITLMFACEEAIDSVQKRPPPVDKEEAGDREMSLENLEKAHSLLSVAFCGVPSVGDGYYSRH